MLENVKDYNPEIPKGRFGLSGTRWSILLMADFLFGFSLKKNEKGKVMRKIENPTWIGKRFRSLHEKNVAKLKKKNPETYASPFSIPYIEAEHFDKDFFQYWRKNVNMPIVIKGFLKNAPILEEATIDNFIETKGDIEVKSIKKEINSENKVGQNISTVTSSFSDFLSKPEYEDHYINNFYGILEDDDFQTKCFGEEIDRIQAQKNVLVQWFISRSSKLGSSMHCAGGDNMFLNIAGRKEWHFIHPSYAPVLQTSVSQNASFAVSEMQEQVEDDAFKELIDGYDFMSHVPFYKYTLEEGDMLFNPPFWWHSVRNRTEFTVGCATRYLSMKMNSIPINLCLYLDIFKNPKNTIFVHMAKMKTGKMSKKEFIKIIFSN
ncbi:MAG: cupin-like domain-containing protein [Balneola sp.]